MPKISISREQLFPINHLTTDDYGKLVDGVVSNTDSARYYPEDANNAIVYPHKVIFDLRGYYTLEKLRYRDETGTQTIRWYKCTNPTNLTFSSFTQIGSDIELSGFQNDSTTFSELVDTSAGVRYVMLEMVSSMGRFPSEVEIFGTLETADWTEPAAVTVPHKPIRGVLGANAFPWDTVSQVNNYTSQRIFMLWDWITVTEGSYSFSPGLGGELNILQHLQDAQDSGRTMIFCMQGSPRWILNGPSNTHKDAYPPVTWGADEHNPASYTRLVNAFVALATYLHGTGFTNYYIEPSNEPDKWWTDDDVNNVYSNRHPWAYATMMKAIYTAVKAVSPTIKIACAGLAVMNDYYLKAIWLWSRHNNAGVVPFDVVNYHIYAADGTTQDNSTRGTSPELFNLESKIDALIFWRNKYLPTHPFWISEHGYGTNNGKNRSAYNDTTTGTTALQADWYLRYVFIASTKKVDETHWFWHSDSNDANANFTSQFLSCGFVSSDASNNVPKASWDSVLRASALVKNTNYIFQENLSTGTLRCYRYFDVNTSKHLFLYWQETENVTGNIATTVSNTINITPIAYSGHTQGVLRNGNVASVTPTTGSGQLTALAINSNESPAYFEVASVADTTDPTAATLSAGTPTSNSVQLSWTGATDNVGVTAYDVYRNGVLLTTVSASPYSAAGLTASTQYTFNVVPKDGAGNEGPMSNTVTITTASDADIIGPTAATLTAGTPTSTTVELSWTGAQDNVAVTSYDVYRNGTLLTNVASSPYTATGLTPATQYNFTVRAKDAAGNLANHSNTVTITTESAADIIGPTAPTLSAGTPTTTTVPLSWTGSTDNVAVTAYDVYRNNTLITTVSTSPYTATGLTQGTQYTFKVKAKDAAGNQSNDSNIVTVSTTSSGDSSNPTAPTLTGSNATSTTVQLNWSGATDNVGVVGYDVYRNGVLYQSATSSPYTVTGLTPSTTYDFNVRSKDAAGNQSTDSNTVNIATIAAPDNINPTAPTVALGTVGSSSVVISWTGASDNIGVASYDIYRNNIFLTNVTASPYTATGLVQSTPYSFKVRAKDAQGNVSADSNSVSVTLTDNTNPVAPVVTAGIPTPNSVQLNWSGASDNVAVSGYDIYRDDVLIGNVNTTTYTATGLSGNTTYVFKIKAKDASNNESAFSNTITVETPVAPDTTAPTPPTVTAGTPSPSKVQLTWTGATDAEGVTGYDIYRNGTLLGTDLASPYEVTGLVPGNTYTFYVRAKDAAGNASNNSNTVSVTTPAVQAQAINGLQLPYGLKNVNAGRTRAFEGPYPNVETALASYDRDLRTPGDEVYVYENGTSEIYWFKDGIEDHHLVKQLVTDTGVTNFLDLEDVDTTNLGNNQMFKWDATLGKMVNFTLNIPVYNSIPFTITGTGSQTSFEFTDNLNTFYKTITVIEASTLEMVYPVITVTANTFTVTIEPAPAQNKIFYVKADALMTNTSFASSGGFVQGNGILINGSTISINTSYLDTRYMQYMVVPNKAAMIAAVVGQTTAIKFRVIDPTDLDSRFYEWYPNDPSGGWYIIAQDEASL